MEGAAPHFRSSRTVGMARLLIHCESIGRHGEEGSPPQMRLERVLGLDLASHLVAALVPGPRGRTLLPV